MKMQIKKAELKKDYRGVTQSTDRKSPDIYISPVEAKPREHVDPSFRNKDIIGTCNR